MFKRYLSALFLTIAINLPPALGSDSLIAKVGGQGIYLGQFEKQLQAKNLISPESKLEMETKENILNEMIDEVLIAKKAAKYDFKADLELQKRLQKYRKLTLIDQLSQRLISSQATVTDSEIVAYYQANRESGYKTPEAVKFRQIFVSFEKTDLKEPERSQKKLEKEALAKCKEILRRLKKGEKFEDLAERFSNHKSSVEGGEMGFVPKGQLPPELEEVLYSASPGLVEEPIKSTYGYHILELQDYQKESYQDLTGALQDAIRDLLRKRKEESRAQSVMDSLKQLHGIKYNQEVVPKLTTTLGFEDWILASRTDTLHYTEFLPDFQDYLASKRAKADSATIWQYLQGQADTLVLITAAKKMKLNQDPEVQERIEEFKTQLARQKILAQKRSVNFNPSLDEIRDYYEKNPEKWRVERPVYVQHIVFKDSVQAAKVRGEILAGLDFRQAALRYYPGEKEIREVAYDLGYISQVEMPASFYKKALELQAGEISQPVQTEYGWHIIKVVERQDNKKLEEVMSEIREALFQAKNDEALREWRAGLRQGTKVWVNQKLLEEYEPAAGG